MKMRRAQGDDSALVFEEIEPFIVDLLQRIPASADPGNDPAANERLFASPVVDDEDNFNEDWRELVEPEIKELFQSATEIVAGDLRVLPPPNSALQPDEYVFDPAQFVSAHGTLEIPCKHFDAWLTTLNRARLVIAAKEGFGEDEMDEDWHFPPLTWRDLTLFQVNFYDTLQQILLRELGFD